ncbi:DHA2 family efflux MFS transporter permease subunit [Cellulosimicrobium arenosum]|uniref:DHA2 family efflux MFS transporter permease subunit n=1 Tax=Cellulosimicrobium arenosum TaxID=2708133 RepID=A0A927G8C2_9MICO|nr:DHA2 family efflux MFS transporter permease subunit [Cellulosimicrobium arenosum]MBD8078312.1 DHA2 family efflux MFS transporter permease subunit [Cellulosimicrobium arenosum]
MSADEPEPAVDQRAHANRWAALVVLSVALSMVVIDGTIVAVALPDIVADLDLGLSDAQWVSASYAVVLAGLLLSAGRLGDRLGRRRLLVIGVVAFLVGSLLSAAADDGGTLIGGRLVQGLGAAAILPSTLSTVNATFRGTDRAAAFGVWGAVISGAAAIGPLAGGWLTTSFTWPWIFLVNLPIGVGVVVCAYLWVPETRAHVTAPGLDVDGLLLSGLGFGALVFGLIEGQSLGWWAPKTDLTVGGFTWSTSAPVSPVPVLLALAVVLLVTFVLWERHRARIGRSALLDLDLFRIPTFRWGNVAATAVAVGEFGIIFVLPLFLVNVLALSTMGAGLVLAAMAIGAFVSGASARHLAARVGAPLVVVIGLVLEVVGVVAVALVVTPSVSPWLLAGVLVVYGVGLGLASAQLTSTTLAQVPPAQSGQGSATQSTVRQVGSALGTALVGSALAVLIASTVPTALSGQGLPDDQVTRLTDATSGSAGNVITGLRAQGTSGELGDQGPAVVDALSTGFADATRGSLLVAGVFLLLGLVAATAVVRASRRLDADAPREP